MRRLLLVAALLLWTAAASKPPHDTLGIPPQDEVYYKVGVIKCRDGSGRFSRDKLNDDFCDCPDGTDEPGTSACPEGKFYCKNAGHTPIKIFSSHVNDGICDCCDGSDEYDSNVTCKNTCWEAGKAAREKLNKKVATYKSGVVIRKQEVERAKEAYAKDEAELAKLKGEEKILKGLVDKLKEQKNLIEKAEEEERLRKEKEEKRIKEEAEKQAAGEKKAPDASQEVDSKETNEHVEEDESKVADQHDGLATGHDNHAPESGTSVELHGSESQGDGSIQAGTVDDMATEESAAPSKEQLQPPRLPAASSHHELLPSSLLYFSQACHHRPPRSLPSSASLKHAAAGHQGGASPCSSPCSSLSLCRAKQRGVRAELRSVPLPPSEEDESVLLLQR